MNSDIALKKPEPTVSNVVLGTMIFVIVEAMFFSGLMSAYMVIRAGAGLNWLPPPDVRLPVAATAINTAALLLSGVLMVLATIWFKTNRTKSRWAFLAAIVLGTTFVVLQGREWISLLSLGMNMQSGVFGATFYLLIGSHGVHAISAIIAMLVVWQWINMGKCKPQNMHGMMIYWLFIVLVWPILYRLVYF